MKNVIELHRNWICKKPKCGRKFLTESHRTNHSCACAKKTRVASSDPACSFPGCGKTFTNRSYVAIHIRNVHQKRKDFKCEKCGKLYSQKSTMLLHVRTVHEGIRDWKCDEPGCGKELFTKQSVQIHYRNIHLLQRNWKCEVLGCGSDFQKKHQLTKHNKKVHTVTKVKGSPLSLEGLQETDASSALKKYPPHLAYSMVLASLDKSLPDPPQEEDRIGEGDKTSTETEQH